jgi:hypothetical protein
VDKGRAAHAEDARGPADKDNGDRAEAQADSGSDVSEGACARRDIGGRSEEEGVMLGGIGTKFVPRIRPKVIGTHY